MPLLGKVGVLRAMLWDLVYSDGQGSICVS